MAKCPGFAARTRTLGAVALAALALIPVASAQSRHAGLSMLPGHAFAISTATTVSQQVGFGAALITRTLAASLQRSRDTARDGALPIPDDVRKKLEPFYPAEMLDTVRYKVGDTTPDGLAGFAIRNGNAAAVTLIDTVVFVEEKYTHNAALWAHELHHVEQYRQWGLEGFAEHYAFSWDAVEAEARARADEYVAWTKSQPKASNG